jgi:hypothetical protein
MRVRSSAKILSIAALGVLTAALAEGGTTFTFVTTGAGALERLVSTQCGWIRRTLAV